MASAKRDIRHIIDSFAEDLILIAQDLAREQVERALTEWQAKNSKLLAKQSVQDEKAARLGEKALRNQKALERIERVAERRREREQKRSAERALRLEQRLLTSSLADASTPAASGRKPRQRRDGLLADNAAKKVPVPAPLFVHKRRRDGEIQQLKRSDEDAAAGTAPAVLAEGTVSNGPATSPPAAAAPEQLRLGW